MLEDSGDRFAVSEPGPVYGLDPPSILDETIQRYNPRCVVSLFSGGHISLVDTHIAGRHPHFLVCVSYHHRHRH